MQLPYAEKQFVVVITYDGGTTFRFVVKIRVDFEAVSKKSR
jgi:hypothetical protein